jgi:hypothetical protein
MVLLPPKTGLVFPRNFFPGSAKNLSRAPDPKKKGRMILMK